VIPTRIDHATSMVARLAQQFRRTRIEAYAGVLASEVQALEDALMDLLTLRHLDTATGVALERVGRIVDQPRDGVTDDTLYRRYIRARIAANRSHGLPEDLIRIARLIVDNVGDQIVLDLTGIASLVLGVEGPAVTDAVADILLGFLVPAAAVRVTTLTGTVDDEDTFYTARCAFLSGAAAPTDATLAVTTGYALTALPAGGGIIVVDEGTAAEEMLRYTSRTDTVVTLASKTPVANAHDAGATVSLVGARGQGFAVSAFLDGALAGGEGTVTSLAGYAPFFPLAGTILLDAGTAAEESLAYSARGAFDFTLVGTVAAPHDDGATITLASGGLVVVAADSPITVTDPAHGAVVVTIPAGRYTRAHVAFEVESALPADWLFAINSTTATAAIVYNFGSGDLFSVAWGASTALRDALGFAADIVGAVAPVTAPGPIDESGGTSGGVLADTRG
jgi:hypothetical protein